MRVIRSAMNLFTNAGIRVIPSPGPSTTTSAFETTFHQGGDHLGPEVPRPSIGDPDGS